MSVDEFNQFCGSFAHTHTVVQWGGAHVWKIAGKVFAIGSHSPTQDLHITFKCSPFSFDLLKDQAGVRPAPYLASRGMSWIQRTSNASMDDATLKSYLAESYRLVAIGLPKRLQRELGLIQTL